MAQTLSLVSWNVNGVRAAERKGFIDFMLAGRYDLVGIQETKTHDSSHLSENLLHPDGYNSYWHCCTPKKGYSGVAVYSKLVPHKIVTDFGTSLLSQEGRMIELHFEKFVLLNVYFPNGGASAERLKYKLDFYQEFTKHLKKLQKIQPNIIFCGDVNTAHQAIDLARPKQNENTSGFMPVERAWLDQFTELGFVDTFRLKHPQMVKYSWWDQKTRSRERGVGWRIDYFYVSTSLAKRVVQADILDEVLGSDHAPILLTLKL